MWYWLIGLAAFFVVFLVSSLFFPYTVLWLVTCGLRWTLYRVRLRGLENIPRHGPMLLVTNHVSPFDGLMIIGVSHDQVHFMMGESFYRRNAFLSWLYERLGVLEVPSARHPKQMKAFFDRTRSLLAAGKVVCMYPEGGVSGNGLIRTFKKGMAEMLPDGIDVPIVPLRLGMPWGSFFSINNGWIRGTVPRQWPIPIDIIAGKPVSPNITPFQLRQLISEMGAEMERLASHGEKPIHASFAYRAKHHPFSVSFKDFDGKPIRNFEMLIRAILISKLIRKLDPDQSEYIGVLLPNCTAMISVLLGVHFADRTPAVLNFTSGQTAIGIAVKKANIKVILTSAKFLQKLNIERTDKMVLLEEAATQITAADKKLTALAALLLPTPVLLWHYCPESRHDLEREAVLLFSSGSSGIPKGVMLTHHNINCNIHSFWRTINWTKHDKVVGNLPIFHAYGFTIGFSFPAVSGTKVVLIPNPLDSAGLCRLVRENKCTMLMATPTFLQNYMRKYKPGDFDSLRLAITGAEKLRQDIAEKFKKMTGLSIVEGFGCTETSPIIAINLSTSFYTLGKESGKPDSIGAPLPGIHVKIVDPETFEELPEDTPGLMMVKGGLVMKGYLDDPDATAAVMHDGFYCTGDIASMSADGYITITGRLSRFSKIAGEMVPHELVEKAINEVLRSEERCIAVTGKSDAKRGEKLVVFYKNGSLEPEKMVEELRAKELPNLWIPKASDFHPVEKIPMLGSGKLDLQSVKKLAETCE